MNIYIIILQLILLMGYINEKPSFVHPLQNDGMIVSELGTKLNPITEEEKFHPGVDYKVPAGTKVFASAQGTIKFTGKRSPYGNLVVIEHRTGYNTFYGHLSEGDSNLSVGQKVNVAELIGISGESGKVVAPILHFEIRRNGSPVDPKMYLVYK